jgi:hypothetical protein
LLRPQRAKPHEGKKKGAAPQRNSPDQNPLPLEGGCMHIILDERRERIA